MLGSYDYITGTLQNQPSTELLYTEFKAENFINRLTSEANPRFIERVPAESVFDLEMILPRLPADALNKFE